MDRMSILSLYGWRGKNGRKGRLKPFQTTFWLYYIQISGSRQSRFHHFLIIDSTDDFFCIRTEEAESVAATTVGRTFDSVSINCGSVSFFIGVAHFFNFCFIQMNIAVKTCNFAAAFSTVEVNRISQFALACAITCNTWVVKFARNRQVLGGITFNQDIGIVIVSIQFLWFTINC